MYKYIYIYNYMTIYIYMRACVCVDMCVKVRYILDKTKIRISYNKINRDRTQNKIEQIRAKQKVMVWCDYLPDARLQKLPRPVPPAPAELAAPADQRPLKVGDQNGSALVRQCVTGSLPHRKAWQFVSQAIRQMVCRHPLLGAASLR